jgi:hypothetical protein
MRRQMSRRRFEPRTQPATRRACSRSQRNLKPSIPLSAAALRRLLKGAGRPCSPTRPPGGHEAAACATLLRRGPLLSSGQARRESWLVRVGIDGMTSLMGVVRMCSARTGALARAKVRVSAHKRSWRERICTRPFPHGSCLIRLECAFARAVRATYTWLGGDAWDMEYVSRAWLLCGIPIWRWRVRPAASADLDHELRPTFVDGEVCILRAPAVRAGDTELRPARVHLLRRMRNRLWQDGSFEGLSDKPVFGFEIDP